MTKENRFSVLSIAPLPLFAVASVLCLCFFLAQASLLRSELKTVQADIAELHEQKRVNKRNRALKSWLRFLLPVSNEDAAFWPTLKLGTSEAAAVEPNKIATFTAGGGLDGWIKFGLHLPPGKHQLCIGLNNDGSPGSAIAAKESKRFDLAPGIYTLNVRRVIEEGNCKIVVRTAEGEIVHENEFEIQTNATQFTDTWKTLKRMSQYPSEIVLGKETYTAREEHRQRIFTNPRVVLTGIATDHASNNRTPRQHLQFWIESDAPACIRSAAFTGETHKGQIQKSWLKLPGPLEACMSEDNVTPIRVFDVERALNVLAIP